MTDAGTKTCPECRSEVPADANVCAHCRHRFSSAGLGLQALYVVVALAVGVAVVLYFVNKP